MPRATSGKVTRRRHKAILKKARGYYGGRHRLFRTATETVMRAQRYAYIHRRTRKREFRQLWIARINAGARALGLTYGRLMQNLSRAKVRLDRKQLAALAAESPAAFEKLARSVCEGKGETRA
jgi:large subunit ribosomal protein L20